MAESPAIRTRRYTFAVFCSSDLLSEDSSAVGTQPESSDRLSGASTWGDGFPQRSMNRRHHLATCFLLNCTWSRHSSRYISNERTQDEEPGERLRNQGRPDACFSHPRSEPRFLTISSFSQYVDRVQWPNTQNEHVFFSPIASRTFV